MGVLYGWFGIFGEDWKGHIYRSIVCANIIYDGRSGGGGEVRRKSVQMWESTNKLSEMLKNDLSQVEIAKDEVINVVERMTSANFERQSTQKWKGFNFERRSTRTKLVGRNWPSEVRKDLKQVLQKFRIILAQTRTYMYLSINNNNFCTFSVTIALTVHVNILYWYI